MPKFTWLRRFGPIGTFIANAIVFLTTSWNVVVSAALAIFAAAVGWAYDIASNPHVQVGVGTFVAALWTYIGLRTLWSFKDTKNIAIAPDYKYCINPENYQILLNPDSIDAALQITFSYRNVSSTALRVRVDDFRLIIEDRICPDPDRNIELIIPRISARGVRSGAFKKDVLKERNTGTLDVTIIYGPPDGEFVRRYHMKAKLHFAFPLDKEGKIVAAGVAEELISEEDSPI
jgi:hypothetical protein